MSGFRQGLNELGNVEGRNIDIAYPYADGDPTRMPGLADELVRLRRVFVTAAVAGTRTLKQAKAKIPIVNAALVDPEGFTARPRGQVTRVLVTLDSLPAKLLQLVLEVLPNATRIGLSNPAHAVLRRNMQRPPLLHAN